MTYEPSTLLKTVSAEMLSESTMVDRAPPSFDLDNCSSSSTIFLFRDSMSEESDRLAVVDTSGLAPRDTDGLLGLVDEVLKLNARSKGTTYRVSRGISSDGTPCAIAWP